MTTTSITKVTIKLDGYSAHSTGEALRDALNSGSVKVNGDQVMGNITIWGNYTLSFSTPNRTKHGRKTVYIKAGNLLNVEITAIEDDLDLEPANPSRSHDSVSYGTDR